MSVFFDQQTATALDAPRRAVSTLITIRAAADLNSLDKGKVGRSRERSMDSARRAMCASLAAVAVSPAALSFTQTAVRSAHRWIEELCFS
jgi:hypothetical protein